MTRAALSTRPPFMVRQADLTGLERIGSRIDLHACVDSTNTVAFEAAATGAPDGTVIVADAQDAGRGRLGRSWHSPAGRNLYLSILLRAPLPRQIVTALPFLAAVALRNAIHDHTGLDAATKWPNDVVMNDRKVGGILVEARGRSARTTLAVVGIGVNINWPRRTMPAELRPTATSLQEELGRPINRPRLLVALLNRFDGGYTQLIHDRSGSLLTDWSRSCVTLNQTVEVHTPAGLITATAVSIDPAGRLMLRCPDGSTTAVTADATVRITTGDSTAQATRGTHALRH